MKLIHTFTSTSPNSSLSLYIYIRQKKRKKKNSIKSQFLSTTPLLPTPSSPIWLQIFHPLIQIPSLTLLPSSSSKSPSRIILAARNKGKTGWITRAIWPLVVHGCRRERCPGCRTTIRNVSNGNSKVNARANCELRYAAVSGT